MSGPKREHNGFIKEWRQHRRLSQQALADRMPSRPSKTEISCWERGKRRLNMTRFQEIALALGITAADLVSVQPPPRPKATRKKKAPKAA